MTDAARQYRVFVEPLAPSLGGGFVAYAPALTGCMSDGDTPVEALAHIYDAIDAWLSTARDAGKIIPQPELLRQYA